MILNSFLRRYQFRNSEKAGLQELGPRFTLKLRSLQKGTFDSKFGEYEFIHKVSEKEKFRGLVTQLSYNLSSLQGSFWVWAQPMSEGITYLCLFSLADHEPIPKNDPYTVYTKFHSPGPIFYLPSSKCTRIVEQASVSFPDCYIGSGDGLPVLQ